MLPSFFSYYKWFFIHSDLNLLCTLVVYDAREMIVLSSWAISEAPTSSSTTKKKPLRPFIFLIFHTFCHPRDSRSPKNRKNRKGINGSRFKMTDAFKGLTLRYDDQKRNVVVVVMMMNKLKLKWITWRDIKSLYKIFDMSASSLCSFSLYAVKQSLTEMTGEEFKKKYILQYFTSFFFVRYMQLPAYIMTIASFRDASVMLLGSY